MDKSYVNYVIECAKEFERDLLRELEGVEAPLFTEEFKEWLKSYRKFAEGSIVNYMRWLRKADSWIIEYDYDNDFWTLLTRAWIASDFGTIRKLCNDYENQLLDEKVEAEKDPEYGVSAKEFGNWLSTFRSYCEFIEGQMRNAPIEKRALSTMIDLSRETAATLLFTNQFIRWGIAQGKSENTMESYVSYIKRVNKELFCKTGYDLLHDFLPGYVKTKNAEKINEMFTAMDGKLTERINLMDETEMPVDSIQNARTALRNYAEFIKSILNTK